MHQTKGLHTVFSSKLHFPVNLWPFICSMKVGAPPQSMWCSSSCYCKNNSRWLLNSRHIWEADPLGLHSCVRWRTSYYSMWKCRQATAEYVLKRRQCSLWGVRWEMMCVSPKCIVFSSVRDFPQWEQSGQKEGPTPSFPHSQYWEQSSQKTHSLGLFLK